MSRSVPDQARHLATELALRFEHDAQLATQLNDAHQWLRRANDPLWSGHHPDGIAPSTASIPPQLMSRSPTTAPRFSAHPTHRMRCSKAHLQIHHAHCDYQAAAERRRELAAQVGELVHELITTLVAAGSSEQDAREANVHNLAKITDEAPNDGTMW